jgi:acylphosphatase
VRNAPDGRVEAEVQGTPAAVEHLIAECHDGPPAARVAEVQVDEIDVIPNEQGFAVAH